MTGNEQQDVNNFLRFRTGRGECGLSPTISRSDQTPGRIAEEWRGGGGGGGGRGRGAPRSLPLPLPPSPLSPPPRHFLYSYLPAPPSLLPDPGDGVHVLSRHTENIADLLPGLRVAGVGPHVADPAFPLGLGCFSKLFEEVFRLRG